MSQISGRRDAEARLWEQYRLALEFLYIVQNRSTNEVMEIMETKFGFLRTCVHACAFRVKDFPTHPD